MDVRLGPRDRVTSTNWLTSRDIDKHKVHMGVAVLIESRQRSSKSSGGSGRLGARAVEDGGDMRRVAGDAYGVCYSRTVWWFGPQTIGRTVFGFVPQNLGGGSKEERGGTWRNYKGYVEAKQICAGSEAVRSIEIRLYHNFALKYLGACLGLCNSPVK